MKALVLGGSGFVGSHVADALADAGHQVSVFDLRRSPYLRDDQELILGDVADLEQLAGAAEGHDVLYNFAGIADIDDSRKRPLDTVGINVLGNANALEAARRAGIGRYVFASSVYVSSEAGSFYRVSKQACELYVEEYRREYGLDFTILRYGTLFGRRAADTNSVHRYLSQAMRERRIVAYGSDDDLREYIHVEDAARLSVEVLGEEFANQQVVLTGHHPLRFGDLLRLIQEVVGEDVEIELRAPEVAEGEAESAHYAITPYQFRPKPVRKLVSSYYVDLGQGLVDCAQEIYELEPQPDA